MLKLSPIHCEKIWGYEDWIASTHKDGLQKDFYEFCGGEFPLLVKIIQSKDFLSVQVHPDDENASRLEKVGAKGKTECWYVLEADENAKIVYGLNEVSSVEDLRKSIENGTFGHKLNYVRVKAGDFFFIPAGTIHAIGSGLKILEIQQSSNITYRIFDWNRGRKLDVEKALQVSSFHHCSSQGIVDGKFECEFFGFSIESLEFDKNLSFDTVTLVFDFRNQEMYCARAGESVLLEPGRYMFIRAK